MFQTFLQHGVGLSTTEITNQHCIWPTTSVLHWSPSPRSSHSNFCFVCEAWYVVIFIPHLQHLIARPFVVRDILHIWEREGKGSAPMAHFIKSIMQTTKERQRKMQQVQQLCPILLNQPCKLLRRQFCYVAYGGYTWKEIVLCPLKHEGNSGAIL